LDTLPDEELIARVRAGEKDLYEVLVRRYNERLYRVARAIVRNSEEAADIVQEALVRAFAQLGQFSGAARFSTWLTKIAIYEALSRLRRRARTTNLEITTDSDSQSVVEALESLGPSPEEQTLRTQALEMLEAAVDALPPALRSVFMMREIEEMSTRETAECLDISEEAVKIRLHRARKLLRRDIQSRVGVVSSQAFRFLGANCNRVLRAVMDRIQSGSGRGEADATT
jgi:RNA polymerase sigma-70 factor (ECF subfamily)